MSFEMAAAPVKVEFDLMTGFISGSPDRMNQGCQIFLVTSYQNGKNIPKRRQNLPNDHKIYHMALNT
jgi:hypothetical protein